MDRFNEALQRVVAVVDFLGVKGELIDHTTTLLSNGAEEAGGDAGVVEATWSTTLMGMDTLPIVLDARSTFSLSTCIGASAASPTGTARGEWRRSG
jgi:hypothetical protein